MDDKLKARLMKVLEYFDKDGANYHIMKGYVCTLEGFTTDYVTMVYPEDDKIIGYSMASDKNYRLDDENAINMLNIYKLKEIV